MLSDFETQVEAGKEIDIVDDIGGDQFDLNSANDEDDPGADGDDEDDSDVVGSNGKESEEDEDEDEGPSGTEWHQDINRYTYSGDIVKVRPPLSLLSYICLHLMNFQCQCPQVHHTECKY